MSEPSAVLQDPQNKALVDFFTGERGESPVPLNKVRSQDAPCYLDYTANLDGFSPILPLYPPKHCTPKFMVLQCACGRRIVPSTCMSLDCEPCRDAVGKRRADLVLRRLLGDIYYQRRKYWRKAVIYTIFTVPAHIRERFLDPKVWQKARKKAWQILKGQFGAYYGVEASHPSSETTSSVFHPHFNFLWVQRPGFRPFLDVDLLRQKWSEVLKVALSDVYSQYSSDIPLIAHWSKYVTRTFPGTHKWSGSMRWYGKYPKLKKPEQCVCADCGSYFHYIGYIHASAIDDWIAVGQLSGRDPPWERDDCIVFR